MTVAQAVYFRDLLRFRKDSSRWIGVVAQPLLFWFVIGSGMTASLSMTQLSVPYVQYFFPGSLILCILFTAIFASISIIEDKRAGFLRSVLVAPNSRTQLVLGKLASVVTLCLIQSLIFVLVAPLAHYSLPQVAWEVFLRCFFFPPQL